MDSLKQPSGLDLSSGNVSDDWSKFKQEFELYLLATGLHEKEDKQKVALLLHVAQKQAIEVYNTFTFDTGDENKYSVVVKKFEDYCNPKKNETYERYVFNSRNQAPGESFEQFVIDLKIKAKSCGFDTLKDSMIRDRIVLGVNNPRIRERLLREDNLDLVSAIRICQAAEAAQKQVQSLGTEDLSVNAVRRGKPAQKPSTGTAGPSKPCSNCSTYHKYGACPAYDKKCHVCGQKGHFARARHGKQGSFKKKGKKVHMVGTEEVESADEDTVPFFMGTVYVESEVCAVNTRWHSDLRVSGTVINFKLDTGADTSIISLSDYERISNPPALSKSTVKLKAYNGQPIQSMGVCSLPVEYNNVKVEATFEVVRDKLQALLGATDCERLGLVQRINEVAAPSGDSFRRKMKKDYPQLWRNNAVLPGIHSFTVQDGATGVIHAPRRIAFAKRPEVKKELDRQVKLGILVPVSDPTDWVNSMVVAEKKDGSVRICIDPKDLNKVIKREHFQIPTKEEVLAQMAGAKHFSKLDAKSGFHQIRLDEKSSLMTTFNTPFGRYRYTRLPMGICSAPEVFQKAMTQHLEDIDGCAVIHDDIAVWGKTIEEHDRRLQVACERLQNVGLGLNIDKCVFRQSEMPYMGDLITSDGVKPDPEKVQAIMDMPTPRDVTELQRALGLATYLGKFIPSLSARTAVLRTLIAQDTDWQWQPEHESAWRDLKRIFMSEPVLQYFDERKEVRLSSDASKDGLGAALLQEVDGKWMPVAYASRAMTSAERNYAQIEKEMLGVVFACERFHCYVYGRQFVVETDHKPLISISEKPLCDAPPRLQRLLLRVQKYDKKLIYVPGKQLIIADTLSRAYSTKNNLSSTEEDVEVHVCAVKQLIPVSEERWKQIARETALDNTLMEVIRCINEESRMCPKPYATFIEELNVVDGVLLKGHRVVMPPTLRPEMLRLLHEGHLGIEKCKRRARDTMYWPAMNADIEQLVGRCDVCLTYRNAQLSEPILHHDKPLRPWARIGMDIFYIKGKPYLLTVDAYSHFPEVALLSSETSKCVITHLKELFARYGIPDVISDNGTQFASAEFKSFAAEWGFSPETSSPRYPQSNGLAENAVKVMKKMILKCLETGEDPFLALLAYRNSPLENGKTPAELMFGRKLKTRLPCLQYRREAVARPPMDIKGGKSLPPLQPHDVVRIQDMDRRMDKWPERASVIGPAGPRSYKVVTESGREYRRNRRHLLKTKESFLPTDGVNDHVQSGTVQPEPPPKPPPTAQVPPPTAQVPPTTTQEPVETKTIRRNPPRTRKPLDKLNL